VLGAQNDINVPVIRNNSFTARHAVNDRHHVSILTHDNLFANRFIVTIFTDCIVMTRDELGAESTVNNKLRINILIRATNYNKRRDRINISFASRRSFY